MQELRSKKKKCPGQSGQARRRKAPWAALEKSPPAVVGRRNKIGHGYEKTTRGGEPTVKRRVLKKEKPSSKKEAAEEWKTRDNSVPKKECKVGATSSLGQTPDKRGPMSGAPRFTKKGN